MMPVVPCVRAALSSSALQRLSLSVLFLSFVVGCVEPTTFTPPPPKLRLPMNNAYLGSVHSSDLRPKFVWEPSTADSSGDIRYEVQLSTDRTFEGDKIEATVFKPEFQPDNALPVSMVAPVGARYFWRVRACVRDSCSGYTRAWYANVGRVVNDYNCDGYSDLAVGAPGDDSFVTDGGRVRVYLGGGNEIVDSTVDGLLGGYAELRLEGLAGSNVRTAGDVNGDGCADLIWGVPPSGSFSKGYAYIYLGGPGEIVDPGVDTVIASGESLDGFGEEAGGVGDVNGDGFDDFYVLSRNGGASAGRAAIYYGQAGDRNDVIPDGNIVIDGYFSEVRSAGDTNGDGTADVIAGYPGYSTNGIYTGAAFLYHGDFQERFDVEVDATLVGRSYDDLFGEVVAFAGDTNGDGFADVLVGNARTSDTGGGRSGNVDLFYGGRGVFDTSPDAALSGLNGNDYFGGDIQGVGDVNGDDCADILIGAPHTQVDGLNNVGMVYLYLGSCGPVFDAEADAIFESPPPGAYGDFFGVSLAGGDFNGDGVSDVAIGAPESFDGNGRVWVFSGPTQGSFDLVADAVLSGTAAEDSFGEGLAGQ